MLYIVDENQQAQTYCLVHRARRGQIISGSHGPVDFRPPDWLLCVEVLSHLAKPRRTSLQGRLPHLYDSREFYLWEIDQAAILLIVDLLDATKKHKVSDSARESRNNSREAKPYRFHDIVVLRPSVDSV